MEGEVSLAAKLIKTFFLIITWICIGLYMEISGPTLQDLKYQTGSSYAEIALGVTGRDYGFLTGAVLGGLLTDRFRRHLDIMVAVPLTVAAGVTAAVPWCSSSGLVFLCFFVTGTCEGVINVAGQEIILSLWKENAASPLCILHLGFGIGSFIVPQIARPFIGTYEEEGTNTSSKCLEVEIVDTSNLTTNWLPPSYVPTTVGTSSGNEEGTVYWAYLIVGFIVVAVACIFYGYYIKALRSMKREGTVEKTSFSCRGVFCSESCQTESRAFLGLFLFLLFFYYAQAVGGERVLGKFMYSFLRDELCASKSRATLINTTFWIAYSGGRFTAFVVARFLPMRYFIVIMSVGHLICNLLLTFLGRRGIMEYWITSHLVGFFQAPIFPSGLAWANRYVEMTGLCITSCLFGGSLGGFFFMWVSGIYFDQDRYSLFYVMLVCSGILNLIVLGLSVVGWRHGDRYDKAEKMEKEERGRQLQGLDNPGKAEKDL